MHDQSSRRRLSALFTNERSGTPDTSLFPIASGKGILRFTVAAGALFAAILTVAVTGLGQPSSPARSAPLPFSLIILGLSAISVSTYIVFKRKQWL